MQIKGIDVSKWQGKIDFAKVKKSGIEFVILRAGYGKEAKDPTFDTNYKAAKAAGLQVGAYWYSYAKSKEDAKKEAATCLKVLKGKPLDLPIYYDVEDKSQLDKGQKVVCDIINTFCKELESKNYFVGLYMSKFFLERYTDAKIRANYTVWVAQYSKECTYKENFDMWQYSSQGRVYGINGNVDMDILYRDLASITSILFGWTPV